MTNIDFVPDDYIQQRQSSRANFMYLVLFGALMGSIGVTFSIIKMRQRAVDKEFAIVNVKMLQAQEQISQLEDLKSKSKTVMKTALVTAELLEPVPKSVILACLTNNLPSGVSLLELELEQKKIKSSVPKKAPSQYQAASKASAAAAEPKLSKEQLLETYIEVEGIAPSNIEVAGYITQLSESILMDNVALVEAKEHDIDDVKFQEFRLKMTLRKNIVLSKEDIETIRLKRSRTL